MEKRKITVVCTTGNRTVEILSDATTLRELKSDLTREGISYRNMSFLEGLSKTELKSNDSILPHDITWKGQVTNNLVIMLTTANKNIKSGASMSRMEAYTCIKTMGLQDECQKRFGKNFTQCKTSDLVSLIEEKRDKKESPAKESPVKKGISSTDEKGVKQALVKLVEALYDAGNLSFKARGMILEDLGVKAEAKKEKDVEFTKGEIDKMFEGLIG
jgi:hypothetical protein